MENQLFSAFQGRIFQVPPHHWRIFFNGKIDAYEGHYIIVLDVPK